MLSQFVLNILYALPFTIFKTIIYDLDPNYDISKKYGGYIVDPLESSTFTVNCDFTNVKFDESVDMHLFSKIEYPFIHIGSNYGEYTIPEYDPFSCKSEKVEEKKTNRGRKPKVKETKSQNAGKYFKSQVTFVYATDEQISKPDKVMLKDGRLVTIYKIKLFRNGNCGIPGIVKADLSDSIKPIEYMREYLSKIFNKSIGVSNITTSLRNCKTALNDKSATINIYKFGNILNLEKNKWPLLKIFSIEYISAKNSAQIKILFSRPSKDDPTKFATLKIMKQKINFEGFTSYEDMLIIYNWVNKMLIQHYNDLFLEQQNSIEDDDSVSLSDDTEKNKVIPQKVEERVQKINKSKSYVFDPYET